MDILGETPSGAIFIDIMKTYMYLLDVSVYDRIRNTPSVCICDEA